MSMVMGDMALVGKLPGWCSIPWCSLQPAKKASSSLNDCAAMGQLRASRVRSCKAEGHAETGLPLGMSCTSCSLP